ncbi:MAG: 30S ribosomal protein S20 [Deltaproteobacteria bacterium]|nr:MAG: 30S ribosomal protein S20 [Deltaproteobacteria bacterium]
MALVQISLCRPALTASVAGAICGRPFASIFLSFVGDPDKTKQELASAVRQIAKAASKGVIHKAQASRRISRLTKAASQVPPPTK